MNAAAVALSAITIATLSLIICGFKIYAFCIGHRDPPRLARLVGFHGETLNGANSVPNSSLQLNLRSRFKGLTEAAISAIPVFPFLQKASVDGSPEKLPAKECAVCLGEFEAGDLLKQAPECGHTFHAVCIDAWLRGHKTCPVCRGPFLAASPMDADIADTLEPASAESSDVNHDNLLHMRSSGFERAIRSLFPRPPLPPLAPAGGLAGADVALPLSWETSGTHALASQETIVRLPVAFTDDGSTRGEVASQQQTAQKEEQKEIQAGTEMLQAAITTQDWVTIDLQDEMVGSSASGEAEVVLLGRASQINDESLLPLVSGKEERVRPAMSKSLRLLQKTIWMVVFCVRWLSKRTRKVH